MGLVLFRARAVCSVDACRLFPQCMLAVIPRIGSVTGVVTKACTGYSARPPLCYARPKGSALISAPLCAWEICWCQLQEPSKGATGCVFAVPAEKEGAVAALPLASDALNSGTSLYCCGYGRARLLHTHSVAAIPHSLCLHAANSSPPLGLSSQLRVSAPTPTSTSRRAFQARCAGWWHGQSVQVSSLPCLPQNSCALFRASKPLS